MLNWIMCENFFLSIVIISVTVHLASCVFFHEPSVIVLKPGRDPNPDSDFGFSMGYWKGKVVVGAPASSFLGGIYTCPVTAASDNKVNCTSIYIPLNNTKQYSLELNPSQKFHLGASIATTEEYVFACAPLVTKKFTKSNKVFKNVYGTCFSYYSDDKSVIFQGPDKKYLKNHENRMAIMEGGTGWRTLADKVNDLLLVAKTSTDGDINYLDVQRPSKDAISVSYKNNLCKNNFEKHWDIGTGLAAGTFFSDQTVYAVSMQSRASMSGVIVFLEQQRPKFLRLMQKNSKVYMIKHGAVGVMFGYTLGAADLNRDGLSELLVGAPGQSGDGDEVEAGALHIYIGGDVEYCNDKNRMRTVFGNKDKGRFGTAIATIDIDGDSISEIFVSSPYEGSGVVYVLSGNELNKKLISSTTKQILLSELSYTQTLRQSEAKRFGFSLQVVKDADENGCDELAVGAPGSASVLMYRCLQTVNVTMSAQLVGSQIVKEQDTTFTVEVCLKIGYSSNTSNVTGILSVTNSIYGNPNTHIPEPNFEVDLSGKREKYCKNITVELKDFEPGDYQFKTELELIDIEKTLKKNEFNSSWAVLSPYSQTKLKLDVSRQCSDDDCKPVLSVETIWSGSKPYILGSSATKTVSVVVNNTGHSAYGACVWVGVSGARVVQSECQNHEGRYKCLLPKPLRRSFQHSIDIVLNMTGLSNLAENLLVTAEVYENCNLQNYVNNSILEVPYSLSREQEFVSLNGDTYEVSITDKEVFGEQFVLPKDDHEYSIINNGSIVWKDVNAKILVEKQPFIERVGTTGTDDCKVSDRESHFEISCILTLPAGTTKLNAWIEMSKKELGKNFNGGQILNDKSVMTLELNGYNKSKTLVGEITQVIDTSLGSNKNLIILIAVIVAFVVLGFIGYLLNKHGFFERKQKKKLNVLRESVRKRSIRLASESRQNQRPSAPSTAAGEGNIDIEVLEDCVFDETPRTEATHDDVMLIEEQTPVQAEEQTKKR